MNYPSKLYKYQKFKKYSKDMLETGYIYFSPVEKLDDPLECSVSISKKITDGNQKEYLKELIPFILKLLFINGSNKKFRRINVYEMYDEGGNLLEDKFILYVKSVDSKIKIDAIKNAIDGIKQMTKAIDENPKLQNAFMQLINIKKIIGVYSLTELKNNQLLWDGYANHYEGFCIEYDMAKFIKENPKYEKELIKVKYSNARDNDPIKIVLKAFCSIVNNKLLKRPNFGFSEDQIIDIIRTKKTDYAYQKEWRLIGVPKDTSVILPIKNIYLGYRVKDRNKQIILKIAKQKGYEVYQQSINQETTNFEYVRIL